MPNTLTDTEWDDLLDLISDGKCTPIIGAGACAGTLPLGSQISEKWADDYNYPLSDKSDLARVAQYLAIERYPMFPKVQIKKHFENINLPDFKIHDEPHGILADLNLPIYITTNYDDFMFQALKDRKKNPEQEICYWHKDSNSEDEKPILKTDFKPTSATPLVYHLHGHLERPQSMVLTEDDYLEFLNRLSLDQALLPAEIQKAFTGNALLYVGYSMEDWDFRVLLRGLISSMPRSVGYSHMAVQLPPKNLTKNKLVQAQNYLCQYFREIQKIKLHFYWGDIREFSSELRNRWDAYIK